MRKIILIVLFFLGQNGFGQEYHFDRIIQYKETSVHFSGTRIFNVMFNSKNPSYYYYSRIWNNELDSYLVDNKLKVRHNYTVNDFKKSEELEYLYSTRYKPWDSLTVCYKTSIEETKNDGEYSKILHTVYTNKKKKKKAHEIEVIVKPYDFAVLIPLIRVMQNHFYFCEPLQTSENSIPTWVLNKSGDKVLSEIKLDFEKTIDINFTVMKKDLIFRE
jgi:hypothetical protein